MDNQEKEDTHGFHLQTIKQSETSYAHRAATPGSVPPEVLDQVSPRGSPVASVRTIRRRLNNAGMFGRRPVKKPYICDRNRAARVAWARAHLNWTQSQWERVFWSDESKFLLFGLDGISYAKRPVGTRFNSKYQTPTVKHDGGNVMVWSCFSSFGVGPLHRIRSNMNRFVYEHILQNVMLPFARASPRLRYSFLQDNDPKHTSNHIIENCVAQVPHPVDPVDAKKISSFYRSSRVCN
uniref:HTH_Tnp_Tc3_2 domain-containing protein n=1 Tax=Caenorhabditis japonica TaxID=281687 RepID=A0A8R1ICG9_CAEJA